MPIADVTTPSGPRAASPSTAGGWWRTHAPGLAVCLAAALIAFALGRLVPNLSPLLVAIVLGIAWRNTLGLPASWAAGQKIAAKRLLRLGIVLLGLQISLGEVLGLGGWTMLLVLAAVGITFFATLLIGRALGVPLAQRILIASGFSICGAAAVAAAEGVIDAKEEDVATSLALVVVCGTLLIPLLPLAVGALSLEQHAAGLWIGASTHEVAQVVAAGGLVGSTALAVAVTVKLARVLMLAPVMAGLGLAQRRRLRAAAASASVVAASDAGAPDAGTPHAGAPDARTPVAGAHGPASAAPAAVTLPPIVPLFVAGFIAAMLVRTFVPLPQWSLDAAGIAQTLLLSAAMFALGLGVHVRSLFRVGGRPVLLAALSTLIILAIGFAGAMLIPA